MKYGVFGGTFNPVHEGHLHIARAFKESMKLDKVLWIPTKIPPHKVAKDLAQPDQRLEMCRLACKGEESFLVSDLEIRRQGKSYTADTLEELHRLYPEDRFCLLMGEDMFLTLLNWYRPDVILRLAEICAVPRSVGHEAEMEKYAQGLRARGACVTVKRIPYLPISSTEIREAVNRGDSIEKMVPSAVEEYIYRHGLYGKGGNGN